MRLQSHALVLRLNGDMGTKIQLLNKAIKIEQRSMNLAREMEQWEAEEKVGEAALKRAVIRQNEIEIE